MSALDIFRNLLKNPPATSAPQVPPQPNATNNFSGAPVNSTQQTNQTAPNSVVPAGNYTAPPPLDALKDFWQTSPDSGNQTPPAELLDLGKLQEAASKADFTGHFDPSKIQAVLQGGEGAAGALLELLSSATKAAYVQSTVSAGKINQHSLTAAEARLAQTLPNQIRGTVAKQDLIGENPAFAHPAVSPLVEQVTSQLQSKFPGASSQEINQKAKAYLQEVAGIFAQQPPKTPETNSNSTAKSEVDWDKW